jgi:phage tail-like protein
MAILGQPRSFAKKFRFVVEIDGVASAGFAKCSELSVEVAKIEQYEGGSLIPQKSPGRLTFADITLERGATQDLDLFNWMRDIAVASANAGLPEPLFKRNLDIVQMERDGSTLKRWAVYGAWPNKLVAGAWDNTADENVIESVTLSYDYFDLVS